MQQTEVQFRILPRDAEGHWNHAKFHGLKQLRKRLQPEPGYTKTIHDKLRELEMNPRISSTLAVDGETSQAHFERVFQTELVRRQDFEGFKANRPLTMPEGLRDLVAFAYVATPPQLYSSVIPPSTTEYHLRLDDMVRALRANRCHRHGWTGKGVKAALIDSGLDTNHPYFKQQDYRLRTAGPGKPEQDESGHGTGVAANLLAIAPDVELVSFKLYHKPAELLELCLQEDARVINCSWGWPIDETDLMTLHEEEEFLYWELVDIERLVLLAREEKRVMIFAGGNGQQTAPACFPGVIAVGGATLCERGGLEASDHASSYESLLYPGRNIPDFCGLVGRASGEDRGHLLLPVPCGSEMDGQDLPEAAGWSLFSGTSAAAPQIAGVVALMMEANEELKPAEVKKLLGETAVDIVSGQSYMEDEATVGPDLATGYGLVDALKACGKAAGKEFEGRNWAEILS